MRIGSPPGSPWPTASPVARPPHTELVARGLFGRAHEVTVVVPGARETVIDGVSGVLVPPGDAEALAWTIEELVADIAGPPRRR